MPTQATVPGHAVWAMVLVMCGALSGVACSTPGRGEVGRGEVGRGEVAVKREVKVIEVRQVADLHALQGQYTKLLGEGFEGTVEVRIAPGDYRAAGWSLAAEPDAASQAAAARIDLVLRAQADVTVPAPSQLRAGRVSVEGLAFAISNVRLRIAVNTAVNLSGVRVVDARGASLDGGGDLISIRAHGAPGGGPAQAVEAHLRDCWFVRDFADPRGMALLALSPADGAAAYWKQITLDDCVFLGNVLAADLRIEGALDTRIRRTLWHRDRADGVLVEASGSGEIVFEDSLLVVASRDQVGRHDAATPAITLGKGTRVVAANQATGLPPPKGIVARAGQLLSPAEAPWAAEVASLVGSFKAPVDVAALRPKVEALRMH